MSGKGSKLRPCSVDQSTFKSNWDKIFDKKDSFVMDMPGTLGSAKLVFREDNTGISKNEYQDVLSTEDCLLKG